MSLSRAVSQLKRCALRRFNLPHVVAYNTANGPLDTRRWLKTTTPTSSNPLTSNASGNIPRSSSNKLAVIHSYINQALNSVQGADRGQHRLADDEVLGILDTLSTSGRQQDLALIERILANLTVLCGLHVDVKIHNHILRGLMRRGNHQTILNWICQMHEKPGNVEPFHEHWHKFFEFCADTGQVKMIRHAMSKMAYSGRKPDNYTFRIFFKALFNSGATVREFYGAFDRIQTYSFSYDDDLANMLYDGFAKLNRPQQGVEVKEEFEKRFKRRGAKASASQRESDGKLEHQVETHGFASAVKLCEELQREGYKVTPHTLSIMIRRSCKVSELEYAETALKMKAGPTQWSILITNTVRAGDIPGALAIYKRMESSGLAPDAPVVQPLLTALCESAFSSPNDGLIDQAVELYNELARTFPPSLSKSHPLKGFARQRSNGPDAYMYGTLLRAMANSVDVQKYAALAETLKADMEARGISLEGHVAQASLVVMAMRCSTSFDDALSAYKGIVRRENAAGVGTKGFRWILHTLSRLSFGEKQALPPIWHYFEIVQDMRRSGLEVTPPIYASLLKRFSRLAEGVSDDLLYQLSASVRRVHDHLTLDPSITPDTLLWNQLMDTYQRVGLFAEAYRVWQMLLISETYDHASVSIIFDACGYANAWPLAQEVFAKLSARSFLLNKGNWNSYVECMCRVGKLNDAVKTVCLEMGKNQQGVAPNLETICVLMSFATATNQQDEVAMRIQRYLPELWASLPANVGGLVLKP
ncbi:hypothetical protein F5I97DRAFT_1211921 [Phlebopus sp. FC_14]|nr:hypothetical protein F5I97DRAFT_1211921 [Phlebopus sp. FC_14]